MNPLSSIRLPGGPDMMANLKAISPDLAATIPQYELGKLAPSTPTAPSTSAAPVQLGGAGGISGVNPNFEGTLGRLIADVSTKQNVASEAVAGLGSGVPLHQAMIAMEEASVSFQLMVEVRNKLLESYQELMRMQV